MRTTDTHIYFYGKTVFSNWNVCRFLDLITNVTFNSSEQAFFWYKADFFKDLEIRAQIEIVPGPKVAKELGRKVKNFNEIAWRSTRFGFMCYVNYLKFSQNENFRTKLLETGDKILVEASPVDGVWGVKLSEDDPKILDSNNWRGDNLLGQALMKVRQLLK